MKKLFIFFAAVLFLNEVSACDICGCGVGSNYLGLLPEFRNRIFGIRYRYNSLLTHVGVGGATTYLTTKENYNIVELWGAWNVGNRFRVMASLPYTFNEKINQGVSQQKNGIGDASLNAYYAVLKQNKLIANSKEFAQSLWLGAGVKLPSGKYNPKDKLSVGESSNLFQAGTGSTDFTINALYDVRVNNIGLSAAALYKINTENKYNYRYGNKASASAQLYYRASVSRQLIIAPNAGLLFENAKHDYDNGFKNEISGGNSLIASFGAEASYKKIAFGGSFQTPVSQHLANGIIRGNNRLMLHVAVTI